MAEERGNDLATIAEASKELGIPASTIYRWIAEKRLEPQRREVRRARIFVKKSDIERLLEPKPVKRKGGRK
jgi:excisionase family DNA binding protein